MKDSKWLLAIPLVIFMFIGMCAGSLYFGFSIYSSSLPPSVGPENPEELCAALEIYDAPCEYKDIFWLIERKYPLGVTTRDEVKEALGIYMVSSRISNMQEDITIDSYLISQTDGWGQETVDFFYNQEGVLMRISFYVD